MLALVAGHLVAQRPTSTSSVLLLKGTTVAAVRRADAASALLLEHVRAVASLDLELDGLTVALVGNGLRAARVLRGEAALSLGPADGLGSVSVLWLLFGLLGGLRGDC